MIKPCKCCIHSECYGWHHWGCGLTGETVDENDTCNNFEEND